MISKLDGPCKTVAFPDGALVTTVTVTYNSSPTISETLSALESSVGSGLNRCVVVDNQSADGTADLVEREFPWVEVVRSPGNIGFARGCNLGFQSVKTPYVLFLNPDAVLQQAALETLIEYMETHGDVAITAPATRVGASGYQHVGMLTTPGQLIRSALGHRHAYPQARELHSGEGPLETNWVCGAIMLVRASSFVRAGGFDPRYFLYFDETDLFLRIKAQGERIVVLGAAEAFHVGGASAKGSDQLMTHGCITEHYYRSRYYYLVKNFGLPSATATELTCAALDMARCIRALVLGRSREEGGKPWRRPVLKFPAPPEHTETSFLGRPADSAP